MHKDAAVLKKSAGGKVTEPKEIVDALSNIASTAEDYVNKRKDVWSEADGVAYENMLRFKKARDEYKSKSDAIASKMDKLDGSS